MSFYIRKSVNLGPLRLNFSKSGVGVSFGAKGARISSGPRGTYIHLGRDGVYYRQRIDGSIPDPESQTFESSTRHRNICIGEALSRINARIEQPAYATIIGIVSTLSASIIASLMFIVPNLAPAVSEPIFALLIFMPLLGAFLTWVVGMQIAWTTHKQETLARTTVLHYELDAEAQSKFAAIQKACAGIARSTCIWQVVSKVPNWDWKRNAGASSLISRRRITVGRMDPPYISTNVDVYGISLGTLRLFFLPDQVFIYRDRRYTAISYNSFQVYTSPTRFIEDERVPRDSQIVDHTWQFVRKDGGPDLRFKYNRQIPVVLYGLVEISSGTQMNIHLHVSNFLSAQQFARAFSTSVNQDSYAGSRGGQASSKQRERTRAETRSEPKGKTPYEILGVTPNASEFEIIAAYRKLAQMYHPDKVAGLAPEFREIADHRMKEINAAYEELKRGFK